jgi:hypothetical protein
MEAVKKKINKTIDDRLRAPDRNTIEQWSRRLDPGDKAAVLAWSAALPIRGRLGATGVIECC